MPFKKATKTPNKKDSQFSLVNDYGDLKFCLFLGEKSADDWNTYHCSLMIHDFNTGQFKELYASNSGSIISDITVEDLQELASFLEKVEIEKNQSHQFHSGNRDFSLSIANTEDIFRVTATIDLITMNTERLDAGHGDSAVSLSFNCTLQEIKDFYTDLAKWLSN